MKQNALLAAASAVALSLTVLPTVRVCADQPASSSKTSPHADPQNAPKQNARSGSETDANVTLKVEEKPGTNKAPDRHASRGDRLAITALTYRGAPYRFGGKSARSGFDCSGLVQTVCAKWGIYVPRAANAQYSVGKPVKKDELVAGDLVFFKDTYKHGLSHVGIYIGDGKFLHAAGRHLGVMVSRLGDAYHTNHYAGARRLDLSKLPPVAGEEQEPTRIIMDDSMTDGMDATSATQ